MTFLTSQTECNATGLTEEIHYLLYMCDWETLERPEDSIIAWHHFHASTQSEMRRKWDGSLLSYSSALEKTMYSIILPFAQWGKSAAWYTCPTAYDTHWQWGWLRVSHSLLQESLWADMLALPATAQPPGLFPLDTSLETLQLWQSKWLPQTLSECFSNHPREKHKQIHTYHQWENECWRRM